MIHLKVDDVTRFHRSFLGVNVQFIESGRNHLRTLGVVELTHSHTAECLQKVIMEILEVFEIEIGNLYSFTTDNGANMVKLAKLLIVAQKNVDIDDNTHALDDSIGHDAESNSSDTDDEEVDQDTHSSFEDESHTEMIHIDHSKKISLSSDDGEYICNIRCAAHTLQLAVHDALRNDLASQGTIAKVRQAARILRTPKLERMVAEYLKKEGKPADFLSRPITDNVIRWHSTLSLLELVIPYKDF